MNPPSPGELAVLLLLLVVLLAAVCWGTLLILDGTVTDFARLLPLVFYAATA